MTLFPKSRSVPRRVIDISGDSSIPGRPVRSRARGSRRRRWRQRPAILALEPDLDRYYQTA